MSMMLRHRMMLKMLGGGAVYNTVSGAMATFEGIAAAIKSLIATISVDTPGLSAVKIIVSGTNLWDEIWEAGNINDTTGQNASSTSRWRSTNYSPCAPGDLIYVYRSDGATGAGRAYYYDAYHNFLFYQAFTPGSVFEVGSNQSDARVPKIKYFRFRFAQVHPDGLQMSFNSPSTDTSYHASVKTEHNIALGGAYMSGTLDVTNGVLTENGATHQLTPTAVNTIAETNNIWSDAGDVSVTYQSN